MNKNFGIGILILCFSSSTFHAGMADQVVEVPPIIVQPYEVQGLNQQMVDRDRMDRDEEIAIKNLIEENNRLIQDTLARQQDEGLTKIDQTMIDYRNALFSRDQARIAANSEHWQGSRYGDLIALTEDADAMTVDRGAIENRSDLLGQKYQMLKELKDEMIALNEKLKSQGERLDQKEGIIESDREAARQQQDKVQMLVSRLDEMDQKISHFDEIIAQKDRQIAQLKDELAAAQAQASQVTGQSARYNELRAEIFSLKKRIQREISDLNARMAHFKDQDDLYARIEAELSRKQTQVDLLKSELENRIAQENNQSAAYAASEAQFTALKNKIHSQDLDLRQRDASIRWLNQVLAAAKNKAEYYRLTAERDQLSLRQIQRQVRDLKADFARNLQDYNQFETSTSFLNNQVSQLTLQLSHKQNQVDWLKAELRDKTVQRDDRLDLARQLVGLQQQEASLLEEKSRLSLSTFTLLDRHVSAFENRIKFLLANHQMQDADLKDRVEELRSELEQHQQQEEMLNAQLKDKIAQEQNQGVLEYTVHDLKGRLQEKEDQVSALRAEIQSSQDAQTQADSLKQQLADQQNKLDLLKQELDSKAGQSDQMTSIMSDYQKKLESKDDAYNQELQQVLSFKNDQARMEAQIVDLSARLQQKEAQVVRIEKTMYDLQASAADKDRENQAHDLNLSMIQQKAMDDKINEYQQKINGLQALDDSQVQEVASLKSQLAEVRQELSGMPSGDEISFLRTGLQKATLELKQKDEALRQIKISADQYEKDYQGQTEEFQSLKQQLQGAYVEIHHKNEDLRSSNLEVVRLKESLAVQSQAVTTPDARVDALKAQLKQKDEMLLQVKANADEYQKEFKEQSKQFQSLKDQLQDASDEIARKKEDLRYKDMAITRLKEQRSVQNVPYNPHDNNVGSLQAQLKSADMQVKDLQSQLDQLRTSSKDRLAEKLKQALDEVDEQGRVINLLVEKLHEAGQAVDLSKDFAKPHSN